jgi:hypothetical protein
VDLATEDSLLDKDEEKPVVLLDAFDSLDNKLSSNVCESQLICQTVPVVQEPMESEDEPIKLAELKTVQENSHSPCLDTPESLIKSSPVVKPKKRSILEKLFKFAK